MSILKIFWKEIAEAQENLNFERVRKLYKKVSRLLFLAGAVVSGFLIPWSTDLITVALGTAYLDGALPLSIMFLYPLHQSLAQVNITMLLASGRTKIRLAISGIFVGLGIPATYLVLAPETALIPGLGMGALGMAVKMVIIQFFVVNIGTWWLARIYEWKIDWKHQFVCGGSIFLVGWMSYEVTFWLGAMFNIGLIPRAIMTFLIYSPIVGLIIWFVPGLAGLSQQEMKAKASIILKFARP
jgi:O-antigen/teichoic acid export membrane protein